METAKLFQEAQDSDIPIMYLSIPENGSMCVQTDRRCYIGMDYGILTDEASKRDATQMAGKNEYNITVNFPGSSALIGQIVRVKITSAGESTLRGELI